MRALARLLALLVLALACTAARAGDPVFGPELEAAMARQDALVARNDLDALLAEARKGSRSAEPAQWYLLGRALGTVALDRRMHEKPEEYERLLEEAREAFATSKELGGLLYAPAFLGLARCARFEGDLEAAQSDLRQALRVAPGFRTASIELAQVLWERGLHADAELELHRLLEQRPADVEARMLLGSLKVARKRWPEAEREFRVVLQHEASNVDARRMLGTSLMFQDEFDEAAEHWEYVRRALPQDDEAYITLFHIHRRRRKDDAARQVLRDLIRTKPGSDAAERAQTTLAEMESNPAYDAGQTVQETAESLVLKLDAGSDAERLVALGKMIEFEWKALPGAVYRLLSPRDASAAVRAAAVRLIAAHADPTTVPLIEIMVFHPTERDRAIDVRREAARALAAIPSDATVPLLYRLLDDGDVDVREAAVQGIADRTGKWFRANLENATDPTGWSAERDSYHRWWVSASASVAKRRAAESMAEIFENIRRGRRRLATYALDAMDDRSERTWQAGYALFRAFTGASFGHENGSIAVEDRRRIAREARNWLLMQPAEER